MISPLQIEEISRKLKVNTTIVAREYLQLLFLQNFYEISGSEKVCFKGGTAIHFLMKGFRFSEDLDFISEASLRTLNNLVFKTVEKLQSFVFGLTIKEKKTIAGKSYLLTLGKGLVNFSIFVKLDFSFRENILQKKKDIIKSELPVIFNSFVYYLSGEEILAEKIRAIVTRSEGRDLFDLWFLLTQGYQINQRFIEKKMVYYPKVLFSWKKVNAKVKNYQFSQFKNDLTPFISLDKRAKIKDMFEIVTTGILEKISNY
jgi:predicted nucleotidyltransferase component of viral defense system